MEHGRDRELAASALRRYYNFAGLLVKSVVSSYKKILSFGRLSKKDDWVGYTSNYFFIIRGLMMSSFSLLAKS